MQPDRFTVKSQEAVAAAQQLATARHNPEIAPAHLLVSLLVQEDGLVAPILQKLGEDPAIVGTKAHEAIEVLPTLSGGGTEPRMSAALAQTLRQAEKEMAKLGDEYISTEHLLLALAESDPGMSGILPDLASLERAIAEVRGPHKVTSPNPEDSVQALEKFGRDLTAEAESGKLDPVIGRDEEIRRVIQVLSRRTKNNPVLIGDPGVGKTAIVEGLAQRIVAGDIGQCRRLPRHLPGGAGQCLSRRLVSAALGGRRIRPVHPSRRQQQLLRGAALRRAVADHALLLGRPRQRPPRRGNRRRPPHRPRRLDAGRAWWRCSRPA